MTMMLTNTLVKLHPTRPIFLVIPPLFLVVSVVILDPVNGYQRSPCRWASATRGQFQLPDCRAHDLDVDLPIGKASFLMAHDAATGYLNVDGGVGHDGNGIVETYGGEDGDIDTSDGGNFDDGDGSGGSGSGGNKWSGAIASRLLSLYGKTQTGTAYDQLNNGARALDLRPKLYDNGTVGFHHGTLINVPLRSITLGGILDDVVQWCNDNPTELVLLFHSELAHESGYDGLSKRVVYAMEADAYAYYYAGIARMKAVYGTHGVPYHPCESLSGLTVGEVMALADLSKTGRGRGYVLAVDRHDMYASFCGKANWVESQLVTCHSRLYRAGGGISYVHCTDTKGRGQSKLGALRSYTKACTNNDASDDYNTLGPPSDTSYHPFNQVQGLWQVDAESVRIGILRAQSNLLDDNRRSGVNGKMARMAYEGEFDTVSIFAMDNVALNGNAMFSVLRNACGQSSSATTADDGSWACGRDLPFPKVIAPRALPLAWEIVLLVMSSALALMVSVMFVQAYRLRDKGPQGVCNGHLI